MRKLLLSGVALLALSASSANAACSQGVQCVVDTPIVQSAGPNCWRVLMPNVGDAPGTIFALDYNQAPNNGIPSTPQAEQAIIDFVSDIAARPNAQVLINFNAPTAHNCDGVQPWQIISVTNP